MNDIEKIKKTFAENLKFYMTDNGLNQSDISKIAGVSKQSVSNWLNERLLPRMGAIEKLADHFHILKSDLLEDKKDIPLKQRQGITLSIDLDTARKKIKYENNDLIKLGIFADFKQNPLDYYRKFNDIKDTIQEFCDISNKFIDFLENLKLPMYDDFTYDIELCEELNFNANIIEANVIELEKTLEDLASENDYIIFDTPQKKREYLELTHSEYILENKTDDEINTIYKFIREQEIDRVHKFKESISKKQDN